ncbi:hypothetical protein OG458_00410 [Streptomyces sp. NBC_01281]|uniref:hypothetical protein n=1 Tax=unclassified Streptomyces TaxID=2593676 RepID=UPI002E0D188B|nr:hypothetical protein OG458_00410 [Streptomyces sp. NBC_01281]
MDPFLWDAPTMRGRLASLSLWIEMMGFGEPTVEDGRGRRENGQGPKVAFGPVFRPP